MSSEINFYLLDLSLTEEGVVLLGITADRKRVAILDKDYQPYFLIAKDKLPKFLDACRENNFIVERSESGEKLAMVFAKPYHFLRIARLAKKISQELYNSDIPIKKRYLIDKGINPITICKASGSIEAQGKYYVDLFLVAEQISSLDDVKLPKIFAFDIETASNKPYPDSRTDPIISVAFYSENSKRVVTWKRFENSDRTYVHFVDSEAELLEEFVKYLKDFRPELLVGYGSDNFDLPYIMARVQKYGIKLDIAWDRNEVVRGKGRRAIKFLGLPYIDVSHFIRSILDLDTDHYGLDLIARRLLGRGKLGHMTAKKINEIWSVGLDSELKFLTDYNLVDAQLTYDLAVKILPVQAELSKLTGLQIQDINYITYGSLVEWFIIKNSSVLIPAKPTAEKIMERRRKSYAGGFVVEPKPGLYKELFCFDFRSLYPSIIVSHNISPDTMNCPCCQFRGGFRAENLKSWFCSKKSGFVPELVKDLVERRKRINEILKQSPHTEASFAELMARQHALKYIAAAFYGYLGFSASRFYSYECASSVTEIGRKYIRLVIGEAEKFDLKVLYGDTDSLFAELGAKAKGVEDFLQIINSILPPPMELELRAKYRSGLFLERKSGAGGAKKRYALLTEGGNLILRGLEAIRGDWSALAKKSQKEILQIILEEGDVQKALQHLELITEKIRDRSVKIEDLAINVRITRPIEDYQTQSRHVVAAKLAKERGYPVRRGFVVSYVIIPGDDDDVKIKLAEDATTNDYDTEYYINQQLLRANYKIFELFGYGLEKLKAGQTTLEGYGN